MNDIQEKTSKALKWSSLAEIIAKVITPISNMILARLLTPEAFGVVATVTMVISFADMLSDSGFQKYLVQHEFDNDEHLELSANVAFTSNLIISFVLWGIISIFNDPISILVGNSGLGIVIICAGISLPLTSFSNTQSALLRRQFNYKTLFYARVATAAIPLVVSVPLAFIGFNYWSLVIGTIAGNLSNAVLLTILSKWKPKLAFRKKEFGEMLSFSIWSLLESFGTWLSSYIGTFIVGGILTAYYLGLYKTTMTTINGILALISSATTSVLFSLLSRLQNDRKKYDKAYLNFINAVSVIIIPIGIGIFVYKDLVTKILLGNQWAEAIPFVGIYGLICSFTIVLGQYASEYFRGLGKPKANVLMTIFHLVVLIPALTISAKYGFMALAYTRSLVKIEQILVYWVIMWLGFKFNPFRVLVKILKPLASAVVMGIAGYFMLQFCDSYIMQFASIGICIVIYFAVYIYFFRGKEEVFNMVKMFTGKV